MTDNSQEKIGRPAGRSKFKHFMGKVPCMIGIHHRSKKRASRTPDEQGRYTSVCTFCEAPMERIGGEGKWKVSRRSRR